MLGAAIAHNSTAAPQHRSSTSASRNRSATGEPITATINNCSYTF